MRLVTGWMLMMLAGTAQADFVGVFVGAGYWQGNFSGDVISDVSVDGELDIGGGGNAYIYAAIEHPIPLLPNVRVSRTSISDSGTGVLNSNFVFEGTNFSASQPVATKVDLTHTDLTLYYEVIDVGVDLDVGLTARFLDGEVALNDVSEQAKIVLPMLFLRGKAGLPFTGTYLAGEINAVAYSGNSLSDYALTVGWETENFILPEFGIEGGYRRFALNADENDADVDIDMQVDGFFINLTAHF